MITIIGSGFGLYGYLPAVIDQGVVLPVRYKEKLLTMPQAKVLVDKVQWVADDATAHRLADTAIVAVPPIYQPDIVDKLLNLPHLQKIILEKPLAPTPGEAMSVMQKLERSGKQFRINYTFRFTDWGSDLLVRTSQEQLGIEWRFMAHHFLHDLNNWRRNHIDGGGALRFYGIHMIALAAELGYTDVISTSLTDDGSRWEADLARPGRSDLHIVVDSRSSEDIFTIRAGDTPILSRQVIFQANPEPFDTRVPLVVKLLESFNQPAPHWYGSVITLWDNIERALR